MVRRLFQVRQIGRERGHELVDDTISVLNQNNPRLLVGLDTDWVSGLVRVQSNGPSLKARVPVHVALENIKRNALLSEALSEGQPTDAGSNDEDVHPDDYRVDLSQAR